MTKMGLKSRLTYASFVTLKLVNNLFAFFGFSKTFCYHNVPSINVKKEILGL